MDPLKEANRLGEQAANIFSETAIENEKVIAKIRQVQAIQQGLKTLAFYISVMNYLSSVESHN